MKNTLLFVIFAVFLPGCKSPEKENAVDSDSLVLVSPGYDSSESISVPPQIVRIDSIETKVTFNKSDSLSYFKLSNYFTETGITPERSETQLVDSTCAVLVYPTDEQIAALKTEMGDNFATFAGDNTYYHGMAIEMLDSINIETINAEKRFLTFRNNRSASWTIDIRKEGAPAWNLIFFRDNREPEIVPLADLSRKKITTYFDVRK